MASCTVATFFFIVDVERYRGHVFFFIADVERYRGHVFFLWRTWNGTMAAFLFDGGRGTVPRPLFLKGGVEPSPSHKLFRSGWGTVSLPRSAAVL